MSHCKSCGRPTRRSRNRGGGYLTRCPPGDGCRPWPKVEEVATEYNERRRALALKEHADWLAGRLPSEVNKGNDKEFADSPIGKWLKLSNAERRRRAQKRATSRETIESIAQDYAPALAALAKR